MFSVRLQFFDILFTKVWQLRKNGIVYSDKSATVLLLVMVRRIYRVLYCISYSVASEILGIYGVLSRVSVIPFF